MKIIINIFMQTSFTVIEEFRVGREIPVAGIPSGNYREIPS
jgi:hypothetical protein